ncbi:hypothetical protein HNQ77_005023 [Silvibacterium bohemicum]|uniref:Glycosyltransferase RgtA/B/C/D-like domain-containing protein n=1 Tax=Silvibacterium bohemicum TaxID=1577686 RepID=A0A841K913_9BACT|nr:hypothetical protein [Silvibacterium bohemicum]MBB6147038.1 hypothetical protein [Silvibacterium bohemicum]
MFDFTLLVLATLAMLWIAWPHSRFAGFYAGALLALLHGRDGIPQTAQRDLIIAVLMLGACAFAIHAVRNVKSWPMLGCGLCSGIALTIKPTAAPLGLLLLLPIILPRGPRSLKLSRYLFAGIVGLAGPVAASLVFLQREGSVPEFMIAVRGMWPYYSKLAPRSIGYLLLHSISPLLPLVLLWVVMLVVSAARELPWRRPWNPERVALWIGLGIGFLSYIGQRKGFPYHRYPALAFLLLMMGLDFAAVLRRPGVLRICGVIGLAAGALIIAPVSAYKTAGYDWRNQELFTMLRSDLEQQGGAGLSGNVQCLDEFSGCINALYRMDLVQSTGFLVDFYFWAPHQTQVTEAMRQRFWSAIQQKPPRVFVVMKQDWPEATATYSKLNQWPQFADYLGANYNLAVDRSPQTWVKWESRPYPTMSYRIYVRKN